MLEIIKQEEVYECANDCMQKNCFIIFKCYEKYVVINIRRYTGWGDRGLEYCGKQEFDNLYDALDYYNKDLREI